MKKYILLSSAIFLAACKTQTATTVKPVDVNAAISANKSVFDAVTKKPTFEAVKISSKIDAQVGRSVPTLDATFYVENGTKTWVNMQALFMSVARGLATPSGFKAYEKLNRTYIDSDYTYLNNLLNVNFIDYASLQNLLLGKPFVQISPDQFLVTKNAQGIELRSATNQKVTVKGKTSEYNINMKFSPSYDLSQVTVQNLGDKSTLNVYYDNWLAVNTHRFPKNVKIIIKTDRTDQILIENTKFDLTRMATPFSVPENYNKTMIR